MMSPNPANVTALHQAVDCWNAGDLDGYLALYDDRSLLHGYSPDPMDKPRVREFCLEIFAAFPGSQLTLDDEIVDGDRVAVRFTQRGSHVGEFMGIRPTGREVAMSGQTILHFRDGRVVECWSNSDMLGPLQH
jgi:predicted ester cyclase